MKNVLFVCVENSCRSQMAEAFFKKLAGCNLRGFSAGSKPSGIVNPLAIKVLKEKDIDISAAVSKGFAQLPIKQFDYVITMGCKDVCPLVPGKAKIDWQIPDPKDKDIAFFRIVRDAIEKQVRALVAHICDDACGK
ncbi:MAG: arsenate reductase ArsC [Candidatus Omnitrophota bacterium]